MLLLIIIEEMGERKIITNQGSLDTSLKKLCDFKPYIHQLEAIDAVLMEGRLY